MSIFVLFSVLSRVVVTRNHMRFAQRIKLHGKVKVYSYRAT